MSPTLERGGSIRMGLDSAQLPRKKVRPCDSPLAQPVNFAPIAKVRLTPAPKREGPRAEIPVSSALDKFQTADAQDEHRDCKLTARKVRAAKAALAVRGDPVRPASCSLHAGIARGADPGCATPHLGP